MGFNSAFKGLISSLSKEEEPRYVCMIVAKAWHKIRIEVFSSVPHFLQVGLLLSPIVMFSKQANNNPGL